MRRRRAPRGWEIGKGDGMSYEDEIGEARIRSMALLDLWLTTQQRYQLHKYGAFIVKGSHSGEEYVIGDSPPYNVTKRDLLLMCFMPKNLDFPGDIMLVQKIMLENNEKEVLRVANVLAQATFNVLAQATFNVTIDRARRIWRIEG